MSDTGVATVDFATIPARDGMFSGHDTDPAAVVLRRFADEHDVDDSLGTVPCFCCAPREPDSRHTVGFADSYCYPPILARSGGRCRWGFTGRTISNSSFGFWFQSTDRFAGRATGTPSENDIADFTATATVSGSAGLDGNILWCHPDGVTTPGGGAGIGPNEPLDDRYQ